MTSYLSDYIIRRCFRKFFWTVVAFITPLLEVFFRTFTQRSHVSVNMKIVYLVIVKLFLYLVIFYSIFGWLEDDVMLFLHSKTNKDTICIKIVLYFGRLYFGWPNSIWPKSVTCLPNWPYHGKCKLKFYAGVML